MNKLKFKVGDRVRIKSIDWYNENKDKDEIVELSTHLFTPGMSQFCGKVMTISDVFEDIDDNGVYYMEEIDYDWTDEMIEGLVEEEEIEFTEEDKYWCDIMSESDPTTYVLPQGYQFVDESGNVINATKIVLEKKEGYPKTYAECLSVLGIYNGLPDVEIYNAKPFECKLFESLIRLKRCRDAYWKIAGEEMGLGKPWEPDWNDASCSKYIIDCFGGEICKGITAKQNTIFAFPTEEMRDAFYENFKKEIEICKELL